MATVTYSLELGDNTQLNTWVAGDQLAPDIYGLTNGGFVLAYNNYSGGDIGYILLDFYDADGLSLGSFTVPYASNVETNAIGAPTLTQLSNGNVVVVWDDNHPTTPGAVATILDQNGNIVAAEFNLTTFLDDSVPQLTALAGGGFAVTTEYQGEVWIETYDASGASVSGELQLSVDGFEPVVTGLNNGNLVVVWTVFNGLAGVYEINATILDADGDVIVPEFVAADFGGNAQGAIAATPDGGFVMAFSDTGWNGEWEISLNRYDSLGNYLGDTWITQEIALNPEDNYQVDVAVLENGFVVVSWIFQYDAGVDEDIYFSIVDQAGNLISIDGSEVFYADVTTSNDLLPTVTALLSGAFAIAWQDSETDGDGGMINSMHGEIVRTTTGDGTNEVLTGDALRDIMFGGGGNDTLDGDAGDDTLYGEANDDWLDGWTGNDSLYGGAGLDTLLGYAGNDYLDGGEGNDYLDGEADDDYLDGWTGDDELHGDAGADELLGFDGDDYLDGGSGDDALYGEANDDILDGSSGNDELYGDSGADSLLGDLGNDYLSGGADADTLLGEGGNDTIEGGTGEDILDGGAGSDAMAGGDGDDVYFVDDAGDATTESSALGGADLVSSSVTRTLGANLEDLVLTGAGAISGYGNALANAIIGNDAANALYGFAGNDVLDGGTGADQMFGGGGDDSYFVDNASDAAVESGGAGTDLVIASATYSLGASVENLTLTGLGAINGTGNILANTITGNDANNTLSGVAGADVLSGGLGADTLNGGNGNDTLNGGGDNDILDGGGDNDTAFGGDGADTLYGRTQNDTLNGNAGNDTVFGGDGDDAIQGGEGDDLLDGINHNDTIGGGGGDDDIYGRTGNDVLSGDAGNDEVYGGDGTDTLNGGADADMLDGGNHADVLNGGDGVDTLYGRNGDDTLDGGLGADTLLGGNDFDTFVFSTALGGGNIDAIQFFSVAQDVIHLDTNVFTAIASGALDADAFHVGAAATDAEDRIVYNSSTGALYYDADGSGGGGAIQFATLGIGLGLTNNDFVGIG